jgi:NTPase
MGIPGAHAEIQSPSPSRRVIFIVGPPGAGKTTLCDELVRLLTSSGVQPARFSDGGVLCEMRKESRISAASQTVLLNEATRGELYERLAERVIHYGGDCALVEMSPNNPVAAFQFYPSSFLRSSVLIQLACTFQQCRQRNLLRAALNAGAFNVFIPEQYLATFFPRYLGRARTLKMSRRFVVKNNRPGVEHLITGAKLVFDRLLRE